MSHIFLVYIEYHILASNPNIVLKVPPTVYNILYLLLENLKAIVSNLYLILIANAIKIKFIHSPFQSCHSFYLPVSRHRTLEISRLL